MIASRKPGAPDRLITMDAFALSSRSVLKPGANPIRVRQLEYCSPGIIRTISEVLNAYESLHMLNSAKVKVISIGVSISILSRLSMRLTKITYPEDLETSRRICTWNASTALALTTPDCHP
jgi:hypothetical protein